MKITQEQIDSIEKIHTIDAEFDRLKIERQEVFNKLLTKEFKKYISDFNDQLYDIERSILKELGIDIYFPYLPFAIPSHCFSSLSFGTIENGILNIFLTDKESDRDDETNRCDWKISIPLSEEKYAQYIYDFEKNLEKKYTQYFNQKKEESVIRKKKEIEFLKKQLEDLEK